MQIGALFPQVELAGQPEAVRTFACECERLGYGFLLAYDHVLGTVRERDPPIQGPYGEHDRFHDPLAMFAYMAGCTSTLEFMSGILVLPQRQTALVARQVADLDLLSGQRFQLGVGVGWNPVEYEALGQDFSTRGRRIAEQIALLRLLWSGRVVEFSGEFHHLDRVSGNPPPRRRIPVWIGGFAEAVLHRAAELADGFIFAARAPTEQHRPAALIGRLKPLFEDAGRPFEGFGLNLSIAAASPEATRDKILRWRDLGGTHVTVTTTGTGLQTAQDHVDRLAQVSEELARNPI